MRGGVCVGRGAADDRHSLGSDGANQAFDGTRVHIRDGVVGGEASGGGLIHGGFRGRSGLTTTDGGGGTRS